MGILSRITSLTILLFFLSTSAFCQHWQWAKKAGGLFGERGADIAVDAAGNSYVTGSFDSDATFYGDAAVGNVTLLNSHSTHIIDSKDIFIAKYDPNGNIIWAKKAGGLGYDVGRGIAVDAAGNSYVTGSFNNKATFGAITLNSNGGSRDIFIAKYDPNGNVVWAKQVSGVSSEGVIGEDDGYDIAVDARGASYITGALFGNTTIDHITLAGNGKQVFVAKYGIDGQVLWAKNTQTAGPGANEGSGIALDKSGNCYVTGYFYFSSIFGSTALTALGTDKDIFIAKYDSQGKAIWAKQAGGLGYDYGNAIAVDASGNSYMTGFCYGAATFDTLSLNTVINSSDGNLFLAKYDADGKALWAKQAGRLVGGDIDLAVNAAGESFLVGNSYQAVPVANHLVNKVTGMFITRYNPNGKVLWTKKAIGENSGEGFGIAVDAANASYVTGSFFTYSPFANASFDAFILNGNIDDIFVAKLNPTGVGSTTLTTAPLAAANYCAGSEVDVSFSISSKFVPDQPFTIQLSDAAGSFASAITIGTGSGSPIAANIPANILPGNGYRIRVVGNANAFSLAGTDNRTNLTINAVPAAPVVNSMTRCESGSVTLQASGATNNQSYRWYTTAIGDSAIPNEISATYNTPALTKTTSFYVSIVSEFGCESTRTATAAIIDVAPLVNAGTNDTVCASTASFKLSGFSPVGGIWSGIGVNAAGIFNPRLAGAGTHVLTYTVTNGVCTISKNKSITVEPTIDLLMGQDLKVCLNSPAFTIADVFPTEGTWSGSGVTPKGLFNPSDAGIGTHTLTYSIQVGSCSYTGTKIITITEPPFIVATGVPTECGTGSYLQGFAPFTAIFTNNTQGVTGFKWDFGDGITSEEVSPSHQYLQEGNFEVSLTVFYGNGCSLQKQIAKVMVDIKQSLPNIFTPNRDGLNDTFAPNITCLVTDLKVYNRYGKLVYEQANYQNNWDGSNLSDGTYFYQLTTANGRIWKGWVEISR